MTTDRLGDFMGEVNNFRTSDVVPYTEMHIIYDEESECIESLRSAPARVSECS